MNAKKAMHEAHEDLIRAMRALDASNATVARGHIDSARATLSALLGLQAPEPKVGDLVQQEFTKTIHVKGSL